MVPENPTSSPVLPHDLTAIVPCYNAGDRLRPVAEGILARLSRLIIVDDGCTDHSIDSLRDLPVDILALTPNRGKGHALLAGLRRGLEDPDCAALCLLDADGQVLTGSARLLHQRRRESEAQTREATERRRRAVLENRRRVVEARIEVMRAEYEAELHALEAELEQENSRMRSAERAFADLAARRSRVGPDNR